MTPTLTIDVCFDLICPWCLIGKRNLNTALEEFRASRPDIQLRIVWRGLPLLPATPPAGEPYQEFYLRRLGSPAAVAARRAQVREAGQLAGVDFAFDDITVLPNTLAAHALVELVARNGDEAQTEQLIEALFQAYFMDARDIGDLAVLLDIAGECGLTISLQQLVSASSTAKSANGAVNVSGVPYYVFNDRFALSGAHPPATLREAIQRSVNELVS
ncbi:hypothetical protein AT959_01305 [Dechloromonas denitrificans]|uniref:DSBA-like thioredoxin domain-containing protein n=1 Tax=Dechloromonas denitrificans TaxID=281362 RepID=A0A133XN43_9RHOO|nr:DsbA family oxidoreductase [Dechloromonas denitrificans]KXB32360.1 hypothetical protein AT959_01305 [Dechloromonas denitrificans]